MGKNAYQIEHKRSKLAERGKLKELAITYSKKYAEIPDLNTSHFWNERLHLRLPLRQQDGMTRDRVKTAANFLPLTLPTGARILDVGTGDGWVEELLEKRKLDIYGNDISDMAVRNLKKRFRGHFKVQSIYKLNYPYKFNAVFLLEVLEHVPPSKNMSVLSNIRKLLLPGGLFIVSVPTNEGLEFMPDNPNGHVRMYTIPLIRAELELNGFQVLKIKTFFAFEKYYPLKTLISRFLRIWKPNNIIVLARKI